MCLLMGALCRCVGGSCMHMHMCRCAGTCVGGKQVHVWLRGLPWGSGGWGEEGRAGKGTSPVSISNMWRGCHGNAV